MLLQRASDGAHLTAWDIWELPLVCPAAALARALRRIIAANASAPRESHRKLSIGGKVSAETQLFANTRPLPTVSYSAAGRTTWLEEHASLDANAEFGRRKLRALKALGPLPTVVSDERVSWTLTLTDLVLRRAIAGASAHRVRSSRLTACSCEQDTPSTRMCTHLPPPTRTFKHQLPQPLLI